MRIAVLTYHAQNANGHAYYNNDHVALESDLKAILEHQVPILSLQHVVTMLHQKNPSPLPPVAVALSCDDGTLLDWEDYQHPLHGHQKALASIVREHLEMTGADKQAMLTAFVIASAAARRAIDAGCYDGAPLSDDRWWAEAVDEGLIAIENHSWNHLHPVIPRLKESGEIPGDFYSVNSYRQADRQVRQAAASINEILRKRRHNCSLFAYPFGHCSDYLRDCYFPNFAAEHGVIGAFTTEPAYITEQSNIFALPRFVCGSAWNSEQGFSDILHGLTA